MGLRRKAVRITQIVAEILILYSAVIAPALCQNAATVQISY